MKVVAIATRKQDAKAEDFAPHLDAEVNAALTLYRDEFVREIYSRTDGKGAVVVFECNDVAHAERLFAQLPLVKAGLLSAEFYGVKPYRGIVQHVK
jgi:hypothetical protein